MAPTSFSASQDGVKGRLSGPTLVLRAALPAERLACAAGVTLRNLRYVELSAGYARALGQRLRAIRQQQGLSLHGVESKSKGRWKAVVVGSYERGDRAITVQKLSELAAFYQVPVSELLPEGTRVGGPTTQAPRLVLDLERMADLPADKAGPLSRYAAAIQAQRGDYNGRVLTVRAEDLRTLAVIYDQSTDSITSLLKTWGVLRSAQ